MRISRVQAFLCDAGWRPWIFVKVETDDGLVGWGECSDSRNPYGVVGCVRDFEEVLIGEDPRAIERFFRRLGVTILWLGDRPSHPSVFDLDTSPWMVFL